MQRSGEKLPSNYIKIVQSTQDSQTKVQAAHTGVQLNTNPYSGWSTNLQPDQTFKTTSNLIRD